MGIEINGIAHTVLTVSNFDRAKAFYGEFLPFLGLTQVIDMEDVYYCVGGRTAVMIRTSADVPVDDRFNQERVGLHHLCLRVRAREDIDTVYEFLKTHDVSIVHGPQEDQWAPGYYSVLFEDSDGIRIELNHVPGKGLLKE